MDRPPPASDAQPQNDDAFYCRRKVLVTGASGFIGSAVCARLVRAGARVTALSRRGAFYAGGGLEFLAVDVCDEKAFARAYREAAPELVFHLAGYSFGARGIEHVRPSFTVNLAATVHLLTLATEAGGTRVILAGSQEEPGPHEPHAAGYVPNSPYGASKFAGSVYARMFHEHYGLPVTIARMVTTYGPGQREYKKLIPYVILSFLRGEAPKLSSARRPIDWIYIDDVVDGLLAVARTPSTVGRTLDLATGVNHSGREATEIIARLMNSAVSPVFGALEDRRFEAPVVADTDPTRACVGWEAAVRFEEGLRRTIAWYAEQFPTGRPPDR